MSSATGLQLAQALKSDIGTDSLILAELANSEISEILELRPRERRRDQVNICQFHGYLCHVMSSSLSNKSGNSSPPNECPPRALPCLSKQKHGLSTSFCLQEMLPPRKKIRGLKMGIIGRLSISKNYSYEIHILVSYMFLLTQIMWDE